VPEPLASAPFDLVLRAERVLVDGAWRAAAVAVRDGVVAAIGPVDAPFTTTGVDDDRLLPPDQVLLPGMVDTHVHVNEPGRTEWEGFASATRAAAAGGLTLLVALAGHLLRKRRKELEAEEAEAAAAAETAAAETASPGTAAEEARVAPTAEGTRA